MPFIYTFGNINRALIAGAVIALHPLLRGALAAPVPHTRRALLLPDFDRLLQVGRLRAFRVCTILGAGVRARPQLQHLKQDTRAAGCDQHCNQDKVLLDYAALAVQKQPVVHAAGPDGASRRGTQQAGGHHARAPQRLAQGWLNCYIRLFRLCWWCFLCVSRALASASASARVMPGETASAFARRFCLFLPGSASRRRRLGGRQGARAGRAAAAALRLRHVQRQAAAHPQPGAAQCCAKFSTAALFGSLQLVQI